MSYFLDSIQNFFLGFSRKNENYSYLDTLYQDNDSNEYKQMNYNNPIVVKCLSLISQSINALTKEVVVASDTIKNKILSLLNKPNHYQLGFDFINTVITHKLLYGNAYIIFENESMFILNPKYVTVNIKNNDIIYAYNNGKIKKEFCMKEGKLNNLLHLKNPVRDTGFLGISSLLVAQPAIDLYNSIFAWNEKILLYNSKYSLAITLPNLTSHQFTAFKEDFERKYGRNSMNAILLPNGSDVKVLSKNPSEMGFSDLIKTVQSQIAYAFGVPQGVVDMTNITYSNAQKAKEIFYESNIFPEGEYIFKSLASFLSCMYDAEVSINIDRCFEGYLRKSSNKVSFKNNIG